MAIIDQGVLRDAEHRTYGIADLLVCSDVLVGSLLGGCLLEVLVAVSRVGV